MVRFMRMRRMKICIGILITFAACSGDSKPTKDYYAVGTYLWSGSMLTGPSDCTNEAPPGVLDRSLIIGPGTIKRTCPSGYTTTITADYADHITLDFPKTAKVGESVYFRFTLRNATNDVMTPTLSEAGESVTLSEGCVALGEVGRQGAQDTGRDPFTSSQAVAPGTCKVTIALELPSATGKTKLQAQQDVIVAAK